MEVHEAEVKRLLHDNQRAKAEYLEQITSLQDTLEIKEALVDRLSLEISQQKVAHGQRLATEEAKYKELSECNQSAEAGYLEWVKELQLAIKLHEADANQLLKENVRFVGFE